MTELTVRGIKLDVDYAEELDIFLDKFDNYKIRDNKIQSCSPFRHEQHPSFAVNLDNGTWVDSGADTEQDRKGNFTSLLCFLREEEYGATCDYLLEKYALLYEDTEQMHLKLDLPAVDMLQPMYLEKWESYKYGECEYLTNRGISAEVQDYFRTGTSTKGDAVVIPWMDAAGRIINIKHRKIQNKDFWYSKGGKPVKNFVYGLFAVKDKDAKTMAIVESEIDALYLWSLDIPAVAVGGASLSEMQKKAILQLDLDTLIIATDMDTVGRRFADVLVWEFSGYFKIKLLELPADKKDVNECTPAEVIDAVENARPPIMLFC